MGDGSARPVGLSLAEQTFVFLSDRLMGRILNDTDLPIWLHPGLFDISDMFLALKP